MTKSVGNKAFVRSAICYSKSFHYDGVFQKLFFVTYEKKLEVCNFMSHS